MSKKKNKKIQVQETPAERIRRISQRYGYGKKEDRGSTSGNENEFANESTVATQEKLEDQSTENDNVINDNSIEMKSVEPKERDNTSLLSNGTDESILKLKDTINTVTARLSLLEQNLNKKEDINKIVEEKTKECIRKLNIDVPAAQEKAKSILDGAELEKKKIIADGKRDSDSLYADAENAKADANAILAIANEKEKELKKLSEELVKKEIQLQNEEINYRKKISDEIAKEYKDAISKVDSFEDEKKELNNKVDYFKNQYNLVLKELEDAQNELRDYEQKKRELNDKDLDCKSLEEEIKNLRAERQALKTQLSQIGADPLAYKNQLEYLEKEYQSALDRLANVPSELYLANLRDKAEMYDQMGKQYAEQKKELLNTKSELKKLEVNESLLNDYTQYVRILLESKRQLQAELASLQEQYESENKSKFKALTNFDGNKPAIYSGPAFNGSLADLTQQFLGFAQNESPALYYEESRIAAFFSWLASTKIVILEGVSGTGKTSLPLVFSRFAKWYTPRVSVQSAWKDKNDLIGFFNDFKKEYKETEFLKDLYKASQKYDCNCPALIVLDEMNISRIEYYFADFLSALEDPDENNRVIDLIPDQSSDQGMPEQFNKEGKLPIRPNIWFIGTANKDDSTFDITDKVYDRSGVMHFSTRGEKPKNSNKGNSTFVSYRYLTNLFKEAERKFDPNARKTYEEIRDLLIDCMSDLFEINIGNRITKQMDIFVPVYLQCRNSQSEETVYEAIDEFFPYKILRKLEGIYDTKKKTNIATLKNNLDSKKLPKTFRYLNKIESEID